MNLNRSLLARIVVSVVVVAGWGQIAAAQDCVECHADIYTKWAQSAHAGTQMDVATELSQSHPGESPDSVVQGEDCIACHSPTSVFANGGMTEAKALGYFFTTSNGVFTASTAATNTWAWPQLDCTGCHYVPGDHPDSAASMALFDSKTGQYVPMDTTSKLCGQCHGNLRFADTDHQIYNAWMASKHAHTQVDVAAELSQSHPGETPAGVAQGEDCIACHAPTAVVANGGMNAAQALDYFFTTTNGRFSASTVPGHASEWPGIACNACHDPHAAGKVSYFNSATGQYQSMTNSAQLCGQCHGNLRFADTDHLTYNLMTGMGGIGVTNQQSMLGATCVDCHMNSSDVDGSNSKNFHGHTWSTTVQEAGGQTTTSCTQCHATMDAPAASAILDSWTSEFQTLDAAVSAKVARAAAAMQNIQNPTFLASLTEAQQNLAYAESDEGGGVHNHPYLMALVSDANAKVISLPLLDVMMQGTNVVISWTGAGTLQSAGSISGLWSDVPGATNPMVVSPAKQSQQQFYRLRP